MSGSGHSTLRVAPPRQRMEIWITSGTWTAGAKTARFGEPSSCRILKPPNGGRILIIVESATVGHDGRALDDDAGRRQSVQSLKQHRPRHPAITHQSKPAAFTSRKISTAASSPYKLAAAEVLVAEGGTLRWRPIPGRRNDRWDCAKLAVFARHFRPITASKRTLRLVSL